MCYGLITKSVSWCVDFNKRLCLYIFSFDILRILYVYLVFCTKMISFLFCMFQKNNSCYYFLEHSWIPGGRLNKKDGLSRYGDSHVKDKTS